MVISTIQFKRGSAARWKELNLILLEGEPGFEVDTGQMKIGDGKTHWNDLDYWGGQSVVNAKTHYDFPSIGSPNKIYKAQDEKLIYQWNEKELKYESLNSSSGEIIDIDLIDGGNAYGTA